MKKIFSPAYREHYFEGYSMGLNPFLEFNYAKSNEAFITGFDSGRSDYERMNGCTDVRMRMKAGGRVTDCDG